MKIKIKDKEIELKYSIRSMIMYENITNKSFGTQTLTDVITYMYCVVVSSAKDYSITFDEFIDYIDDNASVLGEFSNWILDIANTNENIKKKSKRKK